jgi:hypothetical protein
MEQYAKCADQFDRAEGVRNQKHVLQVLGLDSADDVVKLI